jgi:aminomethyltransferase
MTLQTTPLHATHVALGAKMVAFGGWDMPIQYEGILAEHEAVRTGAGLFDVSHMGEVDFVGKDALAAVAKLVTHDVSKLVPGKAQYTVTCQEDGGIVDDCIVYQLAEETFRIVINAANIDKDIAHFRQGLASFDGDCTMTDRSNEFALLAAQGPKAVALVAELGGAALADVPSFGMGEGNIAGADVLAARTGYTGEDGFELFIPAAKATDVWNALTGGGAKPIGLGARDTLRLEARLSLYGNDIDTTTNPYEAGLGWVVKLDKPHPFIGQDALRKVKAEGVSRKLVGFKVTSRGIVRAGADVLGEGDAVVGRVTSGGVAPTVGGAIGLAYVPKEMASPGAALRLSQRGRVIEAEQVKGPFYRRPQA